MDKIPKQVKITKAQLLTIVEVANDMEAMVGGGDAEPDKIWRRHIRNIDRFLLSNGLRRSTPNQTK